jgi:hypothetical protein
MFPYDPVRHIARHPRFPRGNMVIADSATEVKGIFIRAL